MEPKSTGFIQPKRRLTRQRSGFNVGGIKTGSECSISPTKQFRVKDSKLVLLNESKDVIFTKLFDKDLGMYATGGYLRVNKDSEVTIQIKLVNNEGSIKGSTKNYKLSPNHWAKVGDDLQIEVKDIKETFKVFVSIIIKAKNAPFEIEIYDLYSDVVKFYAEKPKYLEAFYEKTDLYKPDIYYLNPNEFIYDEDKVEKLDPGYMISKSCNRCARFLPIDIFDEANALGFSNHCKKKAPCTHNAFSRYVIENPEIVSIVPGKFQDNIVEAGGRKYIRVHFGFQLECRTCKKFEVNSPLNPLRNKAQHHEDGARRRAFERLIIELTKTDIVKTFRVKTGIEFQDYIWDKFSRKCFSCGKKLEKASDMDIDHTLPLAYLWPLNTSATALCNTCNSLKHDLFPSEFKQYSKEKLGELSKLTGIPYKVITSKERIVNDVVVNLLIENVEWFFDDFLARDDYQKVKKGKKVADLIYKALNKVLTMVNIDLIGEYKKQKKALPNSITLES